MQIKSCVIPAITMLTTAMTMPVMAAGGSASSFPFGHPGEAKNVTQIVAVKAGEMFFDPKAITVRVGDTVKFVVTNVGKVAHEFVLGDQAEQEEHEKEMQAMQSMSMKNMKMNDMQGMEMKDMSGMSTKGMHMMDNDPNGMSLEPGQTRSLIWTFTKEGSVEYGCHVHGHFAAGMVGTITIKPAPNK